MKKLFTREFLQDRVGDSCVHREFVSKQRWTLTFREVFRDPEDGRFYETTYRMAATEGQDEQPYQYEPAHIFCNEVMPVETMVTQYVPVKC